MFTVPTKLNKANFVAFYCFEMGSATISAVFARRFIRVSLEGADAAKTKRTGITHINNV